MTIRLNYCLIFYGNFFICLVSALIIAVSYCRWYLHTTHVIRMMMSVGIVVDSFRIIMSSRLSRLVSVLDHLGQGKREETVIKCQLVLCVCVSRLTTRALRIFLTEMNDSSASWWLYDGFLEPLLMIIIIKHIDRTCVYATGRGPAICCCHHHYEGGKSWSSWSDDWTMNMSD